MEVRVVPLDRSIWDNVWKKQREEKIVFILWQLVHHINSTKNFIGRLSIRRDEVPDEVFNIIPFSRLDEVW